MLWKTHTVTCDFITDIRDFYVLYFNYNNIVISLFNLLFLFLKTKKPPF